MRLQLDIPSDEWFDVLREAEYLAGDPVALSLIDQLQRRLGQLVDREIDEHEWALNGHV